MFLPQDPANTIARNVGDYAVIPLPPELAPRDPDFMATLSDEEIWDMPAHVAVHLMRTSAQGGVQIISPRQIPSSAAVQKTSRDARQTFLHVTASEASQTRTWPEPEWVKRPPASWFAHEPLAKDGEPLATRKPAKAAPVAFGVGDIANPFRRALAKINANVDFQRREDVRGDPDALAVAYARLWGMPDDFFGSGPVVTMAHLTGLREHAIMPDHAFARSLAPIQERRVVAVSVTTSDSGAFGPDRAFDWTSARVTAEAKFQLSVANERLSLVDVSISPMYKVGSLGPGPRPSGILVYHPGKASVWCYSGDTFAIRPSAPEAIRRSKLVAVASENFTVGAHVVTSREIMRASTNAVHWVRTQASAVDLASTDTMSTGMAAIYRAVASARSTARTAGAALRSWLYDAVMDAPRHASVKFQRAISTVRQAVDVVGYDLWPDPDLAKDLAKSLVQLDASIAMRMHAVAAVRNEDADAWFTSLSRMLRDRGAGPGTHGWAWMAVMFALNPPDEKWEGMVAALRAAASVSMRAGTIPLSGASYSSVEATYKLADVRAKTAVAHHKLLYSASYDGVAQASIFLARLADRRRHRSMARALRANAYCWSFRSRVVRTLDVRITPVMEEYRGYSCVVEEDWMGGAVAYQTRLAPLKHYRAWKKGLDAMGSPLARNCQEEIPGLSISTAMQLTRPVVGRLTFDDDVDLGRVAECDAFRYACAPERLGSETERFLEYAVTDARAAFTATSEEFRRAREVESSRNNAMLEALELPETDEPATAPGDVDVLAGMLERDVVADGWFYMAQMDQTVVDVMMTSMLEDPTLEVLFSREYTSQGQFEDAYMEAIDLAAGGGPDSGDVFV
jgi:hypothetical protein